MAGHSKWANIQHRKGRQDKLRGKLFSKLSKEITIAAKMGDPDPDHNPRLRMAIKEAKGLSMPKDNIDRAIKKAIGGDAENYDEIRYEGYGPGGVAFLVETMTDNRNRTVAEVRHAFTKAGGNLGTDGSVAYLFDRRGLLNFAPGIDEDVMMELAIEAGADDVDVSDDGAIEVLTSPESFLHVKDALTASGHEAENAEIAMLPQIYSELGVEMAEKVIRLMDNLEDLDDVQNVYTNASFPDDKEGE